MGRHPFHSHKRLAHWFHQWRVPLGTFLKRKGVPSTDAEDIAQEVFLRLMRYDRGELVQHPQAYLYKVASNVAAEWAIRARNVRPHDSAWLEALETAEKPERSFEREDAEREVRRAIEALGARKAAMLKLRFFEGLNYAQIAERTGATERTVKRLLIESYDQLRDELEPDVLGAITGERS